MWLHKVGGGAVANSNAGAALKAHHLRFAWLVLRIPLLLIAAYLLREPILNLIERTVDIVWVTVFTIQILSTPLTRILLWLGVALCFWLLAKIGARVFGGVRGYAASVGAATLLAAAIGEVSGGGLRVAAPVFVLLAFNWAPMSLLERVGLTWPRLSALINIPPGGGEVFFASRYLSWLKAGLSGKTPAPSETPDKAAGAAIGALVVAIFANASMLAPAERAMRAGPDVRVVARADFNGLALSQSGAHLFATGHGVERVRKYDVADLAAPPVESAIETGRAQGLAYNAQRSELYLHSGETREILVLDADSLALKRRLPAPDLSPGDAWIAVEPISGTLTLASEADAQVGSPFIIYDLESGAVLARRSEEPGNLLVRPGSAHVYMSFFRRSQGIAVLDLMTREIVASGPTDARMDRMEYDADADEVLVASPATGRVLRFDAQTLAPHGAFPVVFGVRVMAIDRARGVMLAGSLATGQVAMVKLSDRRVVRTWYLGPWLRSIVVDPERGVAFVSSQETLYELDYRSAI